MAIDTTLRTTTAGSTGSALGTSTGPAARQIQPRAAEPAGKPGREHSGAGKPSSAVAPARAPLRSKAASIGGALQDQVARAQQALDYLDQVASQLEAVKGELSSRLAGARGAARQQSSDAQLGAQVRQLAASLAARRYKAGGGVDANLHFSGKPATQRFRIRGLDLQALRQSSPQSLAFSVGGNGGPQLSAAIEPGMSDDEIAAAIDRAMAPMGVRTALDGQGGLVFSTPESNWPGVKDSIAISGRGRVAAEEIPAELAPQQWGIANVSGNGNGSNGGDALRSSLREVVQALERVRRSRDAASNALSAASLEMTRASTPPPEVQDAAQEFASTAASPDYEALLSLTSALVGVSRERVLALLGLR